MQVRRFADQLPLHGRRPPHSSRVAASPVSDVRLIRLGRPPETAVVPLLDLAYKAVMSNFASEGGRKLSAKAACSLGNDMNLLITNKFIYYGNQV